MANKTIPQLPEQTGKTDDDLLVIVDSGETTTSKIKVSTLLDGIGGGYEDVITGTTDIVYTDFTPLSSNLSVNTLVSGGNTNNSIVYGWNNTQTTNHGSYIFGSDNTSAGGVSIGENNSSVSFLPLVRVGKDLNMSKADVSIGYGHTFIGNNPNAISIGASNNVGNFRGIGIGGYAYNSGNIGMAIGFSANNAGSYGIALGGGANNDAPYSVVLGDNDITSTGSYNAILGGQGNQITGTTSGTTIIGLNTFTATADDMVYVPALNVVNYASLDFADDAAAALGGVELGGLYHNSGAVRIRIT
jgi:hypothetical protein